MTATLLALSWASVVAVAVCAAGRSWAVRARARTLTAKHGGTDEARRVPAAGRVERPRRTVGAWVGVAVISAIRRLRRGRRPGPFADRDARRAERIGGAVLAAAPALLLAPRFAPLAAVAGAVWPSVVDRRARKEAADALARALPETADLLVLAVGAGCNIPLALAAVARRADGPVADAVRAALAEVAAGRRLADALHALPTRHGDALRPLTAALESSERYGTPLMSTLERLAAEVRLARRRRAEEVARRLPVKLLFPLVTCTLPAFGLLTVAPLLASALRSLRLDA